MPRFNNLVSSYDKNPFMQEPHIHGSIRKMGHTRSIWGSVPAEDTRVGPTHFPKEGPKVDNTKPLPTPSGEQPESRFPFFGAGRPELNDNDEARLQKVLKLKRVVLVMKSASRIQKGAYEAKLHLNEPIDFKPVHHGDNKPHTYTHEGTVKDILGDVAEVLKIYPKANLLIEGHTATPKNKMDQWAHNLAQGRADKIKDTLVSLGIEATRLSTEGLPGHLGNGHHDTVLKVTNF